MVERILTDIGVQAVQLLRKDAGEKPIQEYRASVKDRSEKKESSDRAVHSNAEKVELHADIESLLGSERVGREYRVDDELGTVLIKLYDKETGETIREVPPEEIVKLGQRMKKLSGMLLDKKI
jgi:flagellar protein FlaG